MYENFTNLYKISKTLRFGLIPQGKTLEYIEERGIIEEDTRRAEEKKKVQKLIDGLHKTHIENTLNGFSLGSDLTAYADLYFHPEKGDEAREEMNDLARRMTENISNDLTGAKGFSDLFKADLFDKLLPAMYENDAEAMAAISSFEGFASYFTDYHNNRRLIYDASGKSGSVAGRIIDDNLPIFLDNHRKFTRISEVLPDNIKTAEKELAALLGDDSMSDSFSVESFSKVMAQSGIDRYNQLIGGFAKEDGTKIKGLNEYINLANQAAESKEDRLPKLTPLKKQILSDRTTLSFIPEAFREDDEVIDALLALDELFRPAAEGMTALISSIGGYDLNGIYIRTKALNDISNKMLGSWSKMKDLLGDKYDFEQDVTEKKRRSAAYRKQKDTALRKKEYYSIGELDIIPGIDGKLSTYITGEAGFCKMSFDLARRDLLAFLQMRGSEPRSLKSSSKAKAVIKEYLDAALNIRRSAENLSVRTGDKDLAFYTDYEPLMDALNAVTSIYNKTRNYLSGKIYTTEKVKLNFGSSLLLDGWAESVESAKLGTLLLKDGKYYLGIIAKGQGNLFKKVPEAVTNDVYMKMRYNLLTGANKALPHVIFSRKGIENYKPSEDIMRIYKSGTFKKGKDFSLEDCHRLIDFYKDCIAVTDAWQMFSFKFSETAAYEDISGFFREVETAGYSLKYRPIDTAVVNELVENGQLYLFEIWHRDFSNKAYGKPDLSTIYWRALFDPRNGEPPICRLNGGAELFFRQASIKPEDAVIRRAGDVVAAKNPLNPKRNKVLKYDIVKDRRFTVDKFQLNVPITINASAPNFSLINTEARLAIKKEDNVHVIGVSRGENNLIQICVLDPKGNVLENRSLNVIEQASGSEPKKTDYAKLLESRENQRMAERKSWESVEGIKQLKDGYIGQVVRILADLMLKYDAVIAIEDMSLGFKQQRQKIEKAVYQQLEARLISKLNLLVNKSAEPDEPGGIYRAYQLTAPFESFDKIGKQTGFIFYVSPWKITEIDSNTGFVNLFDTRYTNIPAAKAFWHAFDRIVYDEEVRAYRFDFDYSYFISENRLKQLDGCRMKWSVFSHGERIRAVRGDKGINYKPIDLTESITGLLNDHGIDESSADLRETLCSMTDKSFHEELLALFGLIVQMRSGSNIVSPIMDLATGSFFEAPKDDNSAYNIARKGLMIVNRIKSASEEALTARAGDKTTKPVSLSISSSDWLQHIQEQ